MDVIGFSGDWEERERIWKHNALRWATLAPPWRPSRGDIEVYKKLCGDVLRDRVLVLGATPELRDLVASMHPELFVVADISTPMLMSTSSLLTQSHPSEEIWVKADWARLPSFLNDRFDLVIGDMIWWVLSLDAQEHVRHTIDYLMKPSAIFVARFRMQNQDVKLTSPEEIMKRGLRRWRETGKRMMAQNEMLSDLYDIVADPITKRLSCSRVKSLLNENLCLELTQEEKDFLQEASHRTIGTDWTVQTSNEIMDSMGVRFELLAQETAKDYASQNYPVLKFSKSKPK